VSSSRQSIDCPSARFGIRGRARVRAEREGWEGQGNGTISRFSGREDVGESGFAGLPGSRSGRESGFCGPTWVGRRPRKRILPASLGRVEAGNPDFAGLLGLGNGRSTRFPAIPGSWRLVWAGVRVISCDPSVRSAPTSDQVLRRAPRPLCARLPRPPSLLPGHEERGAAAAARVETGAASHGRGARGDVARGAEVTAASVSKPTGRAPAGRGRLSGMRPVVRLAVGTGPEDLWAGPATGPLDFEPEQV